MNLDSLFHNEVAAWFTDAFSQPTEVQAHSWPRIASGDHLLITAPTGSGKTLTAFLWALNQFATGALQPGATRVLYVSPLKALNNDIQRNLMVPLQALQQRGVVPELKVRTRSGDTPQSQRQQMLRQPPEILITTPESLFLLLTNRRGAAALSSISTVIIDEVHAMVDSRRGVALMTSLERLADVAGEFQRLALSATVNPLADIADYVAGSDAAGNRRTLNIIEAPGNKQLDFHVRWPESARRAADEGQPIWDPLSDAFRQHIDGNTATLLFTNSRSLAEKITFKLNEDLPGPLAYAHHGSLAREIRTEVESRLKAGELKAIVATSSLEMGIDIGDLDEVVLVQSPGSVAATLQRIGRAGHRVGEVSTGSLYPTHPVDFIEAASLAEAVAERDIEPMSVLTGPLDVLAQVIVSCCAHQSVSIDALYSLICRSAPYRSLTRDQFELVLEMLAGRYAGSRVRELKARIHYDRLEGTVKAHSSALFALYNSGGTIPDRGYFKLRHAETGTELGELDEEFVWEAKIGQVFSLGTQNWQVQKITHNDVLVRQAKPNMLAPPFWRSEVINRSFHFSTRMLAFLDSAEQAFDQGANAEFRNSLIEQRGFDEVAADELLSFLQRQREATGSALPHRHHLLVEQVRSGPGGYKGPDNIGHLVIHSFWGGRLNRPWALALETAWQQRFGETPEIHADNNAISIQLHGDVDPAQVMGMVTPDNLRELLRASLEGSGFFGARFRECAGRSLLLTRSRFDQRLPLWMSRLQAKKLMSNVAEYTDFPVLLEAWRTCLDDEFDLPALSAMLDELRDGLISWSWIQTSTPSPLAANLTFDTISRYMYADDTPESVQRSSLSDDLINNALNNAELRPKISRATVDRFVRKRQRTEDGYQPKAPEEWQDYLKDRVLIPESETHQQLLDESAGTWLTRDGRRWLAHPEALGALLRSGWFDESSGPDTPDLEDLRSTRQLTLEILSWYGPLSEAEMTALLPCLPEDLEDDALISGVLLADDDDQIRYCDRDNYESLLRIQRASQRPLVEPKPQAALSPFLAAWQGLGKPLNDDSVHQAIGTLRGYAGSTQLLLTDFWQARFADFSDYHLDSAFDNAELTWYGTGKEQFALGYPEDLTLLTDAPEETTLAGLFHDPGARYGFFQLADKQSDGIEAFNDQFWNAVWHGEIYSDSLTALRQGSLARYQLSAGPKRSQPGRRSRRTAGRIGTGWPGNWQLRDSDGSAADPLSALEDNKDRARLLLERYGVLCRELANREGGPVRWAAIARALFAMELAGEVVAGFFFSGLSGPQFMTPAGLQSFQQRRLDASYWLNATDPASPCGLGDEDQRLPARRVQNLLSYHQGELALVIENSGRRLTFYLDADHADLDAVCQPLIHLARTRRSISIDTVNDEPARTSPYLPALSRILNPRRDHRQIQFEAR